MCVWFCLEREICFVKEHASVLSIPGLFMWVIITIIMMNTATTVASVLDSLHCGCIMLALLLSSPFCRRQITERLGNMVITTQLLRQSKRIQTQIWQLPEFTFSSFALLSDVGCCWRHWNAKKFDKTKPAEFQTCYFREKVRRHPRDT